MRTEMTALIVCLALLGGSALAQAPQGVRVAVLIDELVDGKMQSGSSSEGQLLEELIRAGMTVMDEEQSRKIRSVTDAGRLLDGGVSDVVTSLDADVLVVGICRVTLISETVMGQPLVRYDADIEAKVIAVDTGEVITALAVRGEAMDLNAQQSAMKAARTAASELSAKVVPAVAERLAGPRRIELTVSGMTNVAATESLKKAIEALEGVGTVQVMQAGRSATKMALDVKGTDVGEVALALQGIPELGLEVWGYSSGAIKAEYSPAAALELPLVVVPFENRTERSRLDWAGPALAQLFEIELADSQFLRPAGRANAAVSGDRKKGLERIAKDLGVDAEQALFLLGAYQREGDGFRVQAEVVVGASGRALRSGQVACTAQTFPGCAADVARDFRGRLLDDIVAKPKLFRRETTTRTLALLKSHVPQARPVEIEAVEVENLFPSRSAQYAVDGFGKVTIRNRGEEPVGAVAVSVTVQGFADRPAEFSVGTLQPGEARTTTLRVVLDPAALSALDETRPAVLQTRVSYRVGEFRLEETATRSLMVHDRNSMRWSEPESLAAFVDPKQADVRELASSFTRAADSPQTRRHPLFLPAYVHEVLRLGGMRYQPDAVNPFRGEVLDFVQYPVETLTAGTGDCDDLAVLYAALVEAAGGETAMLLTPGHVLVAVNSGIPEQGPAWLWPDSERMMAIDGTLWIPVETTLPTVTFLEAWQKGADEVLRSRETSGSLAVVRVRSAWKRFPPTTLAPAPGHELPYGSVRVEGGAAGLIGSLDQARKERVRARLEELDRQVASASGDVCGLLMEIARLLSADGQPGKAIERLRECKDEKYLERVLNNQANAEALQGNLDASLEAYRGAITKKPNSVSLHANAGIVAFLKHDPDVALEHFVACLELGADDEVARLAELGAGTAPSQKGAEGGGKQLPDLARLANEAFRKAGREMPGTGGPEGTTASEAREGGAGELLMYLHWL